MTLSVESFLHAFLPHRYVDHTHADSILILTNQKNGEKLIRDALGTRIGIIPYALSGLPLARAVAAQYEKNPEIVVVVIINHGIFTFGEDALTSYERMIDYVSRAEAFIKPRLPAKTLTTPRDGAATVKEIEPLAACFSQIIRGACAHRTDEGRLCRFRVEYRNTPDLLEASISKEARNMCVSGVLTPDHVTRTKNRFVYIDAIPQQADDLGAKITPEIDKFVKEYHGYFQQQITSKGLIRKELDPYPRVFLAAGLGLFTLGFSHRKAVIAADIAERTIYAKLQAAKMGAYQPISDSHIFDMEYWSLQQKNWPNAHFLCCRGRLR